MDDLVKKAMEKWPNVPDCYGWLGLDTRGRWYMRDDATQHAGHFQSGLLQAKGSELKHEKLIEFIARNYAPDEEGQWYFQNGPQRVYVELQATPWIWRLNTNYAIVSHTGKPAEYKEAFLDENGLLYLNTDCGFGLVHSQDVYLAGQAIEDKGWNVTETNLSDLQSKFKYVVSPENRNNTEKNKASM